MTPPTKEEPPQWFQDWSASQQVASKLDHRLLYLVFAGTMFLVLLMIGISKWSPDDGQTFTALSTMAGGFGGAFLRALPNSSETSKPEPRQ